MSVKSGGFVGKLKKAKKVSEDVQEQTGAVTKDGKKYLYHTLDTIRDSKERLIYQSGSLAATMDFLQKDSPKRPEYEDVKSKIDAQISELEGREKRQ